MCSPKILRVLGTAERPGTAQAGPWPPAHREPEAELLLPGLSRRGEDTESPGDPKK